MKTASICAALMMMVLSPPAVRADTDTEIRAVLDFMEEVWSEGDLETIRGHYGSDFTYLSASAELNLKQRIDDLEVVMKAGEDRGILEYTDVQVRPLGDDHALTWGKVRLRFGDGTELDSLFSSVYEKTPFGWKLVFTHD